jgi:hypothetical protein
MRVADAVRAVRACTHSQPSLPQKPRSSAEDQKFARSLTVMGDLYASAVGTTVLQLKEIPTRPAEYNGALCLFLNWDEGKQAYRDVSREAVEAALGGFGTIKSCELTGDLRDHQGAVVVRFATHAAALAAKKAGPFPELCAGVDTLYNERSYDGRRGEAGRADDEGRGWCCLEDGVSGELLIRLRAYPKMRDALAKLRPKMLKLRSGQQAVPVDLVTEELEGRVERVIARIQSATFTGKGDKEKVPALYKTYVARIAMTLQSIIGLAGGAAAGGREALPEMPADTSFEAVRAWHLEVLRVQHASIADALSGKRLDVRTQCVQIAITGTDAAGQPIAVRDASALS